MTKVRKKPKKNITKNINKKSFIQNTPNIAEKLDNEMVAFLDTEFLTSQVKGGPPAKLVSVGFVVCGKDFEEVTRFHSYIYAEDKLHDRFQEMTGIERKDLLSAPDYELVMEEVAEQLEAWEVSRVYVWGPDKYVIQRDLLEYRKDASKRTKKIVNRILRMIKDIEDIYSAKLDLQSAGIGSLKILCGLGTEVSHNALDDAVDSGNIYDLIFMDIILKKENGIYLSDNILKKINHVKIVFVTGYVAYVEDIFDIEPFALLVKPIKEEKVLHILEKAFQALESGSR